MMSKVLSFVLFFYASYIYSTEVSMKQLQTPPNRLEQYLEIATQYNDELPELWNALQPEERVFAYYMYRASIPGNRIIADQTHRHANEITELFERIVRNKEIIREKCSEIMDVEKFLQEAQTFLVYLFAHHGQYFLREFEDHKRTPEKLNLSTLTDCNLVAAVQTFDSKAQEIVKRIYASIFETTVEPTVTVEGNIEKSAGNYYSPDFTEQDFESLDPAIKSVINAYFYVETNSGKREIKVQRYKIGEKYSEELQVAHHWITKAREHALRYPQIFDEYVPKSLAHMLQYLTSGDEQDFKNFSIDWIKTKSRIDFNFGFVEVYQDPKQYRGAFEADVTVKVVDMEKLSAILPALEQQLPFPDEFKRQNLGDFGAIPNASLNAKIFASGEAGPVKLTAAYCLPNYSEIRAEHGSKQIIYQQGKGLGELVNPELAKRLFLIQEHIDWTNQYDPENKLDHIIWDVHVILHETLGHGSGRLATHTFVEGDPLTIDGTTYTVGDTMQVTNDNSNEFIGGYSSGLEELRAEIIALYMSIFNFDDLAAAGLFKGWDQQLGKEQLIERMIIHMAEHGLKKLLSQKDDATEIMQAHARANTTIMNYLLDAGGMELVEEQQTVNGNIHTVIGIRMTDLAKSKQAVKKLAIEVQRITSTADGQAVRTLMDTYGTCVRKPEYIKILKANRQAVQGELKEVAEIFPRLTPVTNEDGDIIDIAASWPAGFLEQQLELSELALSKQ